MNNSRIQALKLNKKLLFGTRFFLELKSLNSVVQLFYLSRGLDISQVITLSLVWTIASFFSDIPSSILADKFGRKKMIIAGILLTSLSTFLLFFAHSYLYFILTYILAATGFSFFTGTDHALLYDSLKEAGEEGNSTRVAGKYFSAQSLPKIFMPLLGSFIARGLTAFQFNLLIGIDFVGSLIALIISSFLTEPSFKDQVAKKTTILKAGFNLIKSDKILLKFALNKIIIFQATFIYWRIYQIFLKNADMPTVYLGLIYTVFQTILFLMYWHTDWAQNIFGKERFANYPVYLGFLAIIISLVTSNLILLFITCIIIFISGTIRDPFFMTQMQHRIPSFNRATATSTLNTIKNISDVPILLLVGYLAKTNINNVLIASAVLFLIPIIFLKINKSEIKV